MNYVVRITQDNKYCVVKPVQDFGEAAAATLEHKKSHGGIVFMRDGATGRRYSIIEIERANGNG